jgi:hypothetical protein
MPIRWSTTLGPSFPASIGLWLSEGLLRVPFAGQPAHPESAYLKAFLIRIKYGLSYTTQLREFLLKHPLFVIE